ncbi:hypothetical protein SESBI_17202 [Sesbania bispinosa]|nr:hypothetical protein SESBI_17202 [Sesbania bispinosa]
MRPPPPRRVSTSTGNSSGSKRKEKVDGGFKRPTAVPTAELFQPDKQKAEPEPKKNGSKPVMTCTNKKLLAGYLAHEFLTKGTLLGQRWGRLPSPRGEPLQDNRVVPSEIPPDKPPDKPPTKISFRDKVLGDKVPPIYATFKIRFISSKFGEDIIGGMQ